MIVNYNEQGWEVVTQRAHGLLAAQICAQWQRNKYAARRIDTIIAVAEHDDVYNEFDLNNLLNETGGPVNFKMNNFNEENSSRLIQMAVTKSTYIALLIARHIQFVYGNDPAAQAYCKMLKKQEKEWLKIAGATVDEVNWNYELLQCCDAFSLLICQRQLPPEQRKMEISKGPGGVPYELSCNKKAVVVVEPWPFELPSFKVNYESRQLNQLVFKNVPAFRAALEAAPVTFNELTLSNLLKL